MMTAFYAVIVLTLAIAWGQSPKSLLELYAPAAYPARHHVAACRLGSGPLSVRRS